MVRRICFPFIGDTVGGSHIAALPLLRKLDRNRFQPVVVVHQSGPLTAYFDDEGIDYSILNLTGFLNGGIGLYGYSVALGKVIPRIVGFLYRHRIDVVHGNDLRTNHTWSAAVRLTSAVMVWHQRTKFAPSRMTSLTMRLADQIICNSEFCRAMMPSAQGGRAVLLIDPFDVETPPPLRSAARQPVLAATGWPGDSRIIGFCGTLSRQKRPDVFIDAAALVAAEIGPSARFAILGSNRDGLQAELEARAARLGIAEQVSFLGFRSPGQEWIAGFDVLAAPQFDDSFPRNLLEAMHAGTPVVASKTGGHLEIIENGVSGILTEKDDAQDMARGIVTILSQIDLREAIIVAAATSVRKRYAERPHIEACEKLYTDLSAATAAATPG
jgi:glycosyltransferase involved in cell wall biosynthesis